MDAGSGIAVSSMETIKEKADRARALHTLKDHAEVENTYDELASTYDQFSSDLEYSGPAYTASVVEKIEVNPNARILDVGCGTGLIGDELHKAGYRNVYGVDLSRQSLDIVKKKGTYTNLVYANFGPETPLDFSDGYFDLAMSCGCFLPQHLNEQCLPEMIRLVKPGGHLVITTRKYIFDGETGDMKLKPGLLQLTKDGSLAKVRHEESLYQKNGGDHIQGITLIYQVI